MNTDHQTIKHKGMDPGQFDRPSKLSTTSNRLSFTSHVWLFSNELMIGLDALMMYRSQQLFPVLLISFSQSIEEKIVDLDRIEERPSL